MKKALKGIVLLTTLTTAVAQAAYYNPRISVWGLAGSQEQVRGDLLFPLYGAENDLFYTDIQASYTHDHHSKHGDYAGIGAGFRKLCDCKVYGAYLFVDRDETHFHNVFTVLNPGVEAFFPEWDFRLNGYFPVSDRRKTVRLFSSEDGDCRFVEFKGHQQFDKRVAIFEQAGIGGDSEVGYTIHALNNTQLHAGVYYFNFDRDHGGNDSHGTRNITGVEGRLEIPVNPFFAVTVESSYDNYQHGAILGGLRVNFGGTKPASICDMHAHMVDPISRNLGTLKTGSGIPTVKTKKDEGIFLQRDNIYFFSAEGGSIFVDKQHSGTYENPLRNDQFSQAVVDQIGHHANLYFNSGAFSIMGMGTAPNAQINLPFGDSIYGRTFNFKCPAKDDARPTLLGRINLLEGDNTIDSMKLLNKIISDGNSDVGITTLSIQNANHIILSNDDINAFIKVKGDLNANNLACGINANNSQVVINDSIISAKSDVTKSIATSSSNAFTNYATAIGGDATNDFIGNHFTLKNTGLIANSSVGLDNNGANASVAIGSNNGNFSQNDFKIKDGSIAVIACVGQDNFHENLATIMGANASNNFENNTLHLEHNDIRAIAQVGQDNQTNSFNSAICIGNIGNNSFDSNTFDLVHNNIALTAQVDRDNVIRASNITHGIGGSYKNNTFNLLANNIESNASTGRDNNGTNFANFISNDGGGNTFNLTHNNLFCHAEVARDNGFFNAATAIGGRGNFAKNNLTLIDNTILTTAQVNRDNHHFNFATAIGSGFTGVFNNNSLRLTGNTISAVASVGRDNLHQNSAIAIGSAITTFRDNTFTLDHNCIEGIAKVGRDNLDLNSAIGIGTNSTPAVFFIGNTFNASNCSFNVISSVDRNNTHLNQAVGINFNNVVSNNNTAYLDHCDIHTLADVNGINSGSNAATGLDATGTGNLIQITDTFRKTIANAMGPGSNTETDHAGNVIIINNDMESWGINDEPAQDL